MVSRPSRSSSATSPVNTTRCASGWSAARERIDGIRASLREQSKLLAYYEVERTELVDEPLATLPVSAQDPAQAIDEVLAAWPAR